MSLRVVVTGVCVGVSSKEMTVRWSFSGRVWWEVTGLRAHNQVVLQCNGRLLLALWKATRCTRHVAHKGLQCRPV